MIELAAIMIVRLKWLHGKTQKVCVQRNFDRTRHVSYSQCETWNKSEWENPYLAISVCQLLNHEVVGCLVIYKIVLGYENSLNRFMIHWWNSKHLYLIISCCIEKEGLVRSKCECARNSKHVTTMQILKWMGQSKP